MKIYLSGSANMDTEKSFISKGYSRLFSNYSDRKHILKYIECGGTNIMLDSGAFSAYNSNKIIDIDDYISFANSIDSYCKWVINLDVIGGDPQQSFNNFVYIRKRLKSPLKLMPVYHQNEPIEWIYKYLDYEDEFGGVIGLGLGGVARTPTTGTVKMLDMCTPILSQYPNTWVHLFGVTTTTIVDRYPYIDSCDSITWRLNSAYANIILPPKYTCIHLGHGKTRESMKRGYIPRELIKNQLVQGKLHPLVSQALIDLDIDIDSLYDDTKAMELFNAFMLNQWASNYTPSPYVIKQSLF